MIEETTLPDVDTSTAKPMKKHVTTARKTSSGSLSTQSNQLDDVLAIIEDIQGRVVKVERRLFWMMMSGWFKLLIIIVPIALGIVYLPSLIENYKSLFSSNTESANIIEQFQEVFQTFGQ